MGGRSSNLRPGARCRRGPKCENGLARSDQCGSHKMLMPSIWISTVEWPTNVTRSSPRKTRLGGGGPFCCVDPRPPGPRLSIRKPQKHIHRARSRPHFHRVIEMPPVKMIGNWPAVGFHRDGAEVTSPRKSLAPNQSRRAQQRNRDMPWPAPMAAAPFLPKSTIAIIGSKNPYGVPGSMALVSSRILRSSAGIANSIAPYYLQLVPAWWRR